MAFFSDLLSGSPGVQSTDVTGSLPAWYQQALVNLIGKGAALADQPYPQYTGQAIAGFTPQQQQAFDLTSQQVGAYQPLTQQAQGLISGSSTYDPEQFQKFLSPYTSGVVDEIGRLGQRQLMEQALPGALSAFTGAGQFGSTRSQEFASRTVRDTMADIAGKQAAALQAAYQQAQQGYGDWANRGLQGAGALGNLAQAQQAMGLKDIGALGAAGQAQQQLGQQNLDWARQQFQEQAQYPQQQLGNLAALLRGYQLPTSETRTATGMAPTTTSPFAQVVGGLSQYASMNR